MRVLLRIALVTCLAIVAGGWLISRPGDLPSDWGAGLTGDAEAGRLLLAAGGCASCHTAPGAEPGPTLVLAGGRSFPSPFGTFLAPNISTDPEHGIGGWSFETFARALVLGVSPEGAHFYPAFPYASYSLMKPQDAVDLFAYLQTLPPDSTPSRAHQVSFPFSLRRGIGIWKAIYMPDGFTVTGDLTETQERGRYLAEALAHCAECHTPRTVLGGLDRSQWMAGAPDPSGVGRIPGITRRQLDWSEADLVTYFTSGFTPEYDTAGSHMADVVRNLAQLPEADRQALAAYVLMLP